jgi:phosphatidate cytidylyltransferase
VALSNLAARVLFAVVAIPVVVGAVYAGGLFLALLLAVAAALAAAELFRMVRATGGAPFAVAGVVIAFLLPVAVAGYQLGRFNPPVLTLGAVVVLALLAAAIWLRGPHGHPLGAVATTLFGVLYTAGMLSFAYAIRYHNYVLGAPAGTALVVLPLAVAWGSDTAAYFVGRAIGRRKLSPAVSPGKTVEGAIGGLAAAMLVSWAYARFVLPRYAMLGMTPRNALLFGLIVGVAVQVGDLAESLIKREADVKDSSHLIPGHGGVLDRIDSLLFALPVAYFVFTFPHVLIPAIR